MFHILCAAVDTFALLQVLVVFHLLCAAVDTFALLQVLVVFLLLCAASSGNLVVELSSGVLIRHAAQLAG